MKAVNRFENIQHKLEKFIKKYYTNELIKGGILFFSIGLLYFILTLFIEHFLWLKPTARTFLFWVFVLVEIGLFVRFILFPLSKLFKLQKGIDKIEAAKIIGSHFPEVNDKLLNVLQLANDEDRSELLMASIDQKSSELQPVPFNIAVNFKRNLSYLKYAAIPLTIVVLVWVSGNIKLFTDSYSRVVNYQEVYLPPAPFEFFVINTQLKAIENMPYRLDVRTTGETIPDEVKIVFGEELYFLQNEGEGKFSYIFSQPKSSVDFKLMSNAVSSKPYVLEVVKVPSLTKFEMKLDYPGYTQKRDEVLSSTGNAVVPEGTMVSWKLSTKQTSNADLITKDTVYKFSGESPSFRLDQRLFKNVDYELGISNKDLKHYERLGFSITVVKDQYPQIKVKEEKDSTDIEKKFFFGELSDDYGLSGLNVVYFESGQEDKLMKYALDVKSRNFDRFVYRFPDGLDLQEGISYEFYFELKDNDIFRGGKISKSQTFNYRKFTKEELVGEQLKQQSENIKDFDKTLDKLKEQQQELKELSKNQKEKDKLNFNDKKKLENFLKRQSQQEELMQKFTEEIKRNLEEFQKEDEQDDEYKKLLKERLERQQKELEKNEKLMKEIEKLSEKINKEELSKKLDELSKQQQKNERSLEQVLELTKRYYVTQKAEELQKELSELAKKQDELSEKKGDENSKEKQDKLNDEFEDLKKQMDALQKENQELKKPLKLPKDKKTEEEITKEQKEASENLEKKEEEKKKESEAGEEQKQESQKKQEQQEQKAKANQKRAAQKMKKMSKKMKQSMPGGGGGDTPQEDAEALRQILDNLVEFSFEQESLLNRFRDIDNSSAGFAGGLKKQRELKDIFEHVDDSLFSLSLRQPKISERINENITDVYFNMDRAMERLADNQVYQGVGNQQYALTAANDLASFLSDVLDNMEDSMSSSGSGSGSKSKGFQLPDLIQSQEQLNEKMKEGMKKGKDGKPKSPGQGKPGKEGEPKESGDEGKPGEKGENGKEGKNGKEPGKDGKGGGGSGEGEEEQNSEELFEIYKQQQQLRQALEEQLKDKKGLGGNGDAKRLVKEMENIESQLLEKGMTNQVLQKMIQMKHQLLKLKDAAFQQGQKEERESKTNYKEFDNKDIRSIPGYEQYFNQIEILNRQVLPLRQIYKRKVQDYFKEDDSL